MTRADAGHFEADSKRSTGDEMNTPQFALLLLGSLTLSGCGRDVAVPGASSPASQQSPPAETVLPIPLPPQTNQVIHMGTVHVDGGVRHLSPEEVLLEAEPGEDVTRLIEPDMTLVDDRHRE